MKYAVCSVKGGVGKTTIVANLGAIFTKMGKKTLLVDADLACSHLSLHHLGLTEPKTTLHDLLSRGTPPAKEAILEAVDEGPGGIHLLASGPSLQGFLRSNLGWLPELISKASEEYEFVLIDTPPGLSGNSIIPLRASDSILLVATPDRPSISGASTMRTVGLLLDRKISGVVVNKVPSRFLLGRSKRDVTEVGAMLATEVLGVIPEDGNVREALKKRLPVAIYKPRSPASKAFKALSSTLLRLMKRGP